MKDLRRIVYVLMLILPLVYGCGKEDIEPRNQILNGGVAYELSKAAIIDYGKAAVGEAYSLNLYLMSSDIGISGKNTVPDSISGKGHLILFEMYSDKPKQLALGKYEFDAMQYRKVKSFGPANAIFNANYQTKTGDEYAIISGSVVVSKNNEEYIIEFDCMDIRGKRLNGYFKGGIAYFNIE